MTNATPPDDFYGKLVMALLVTIAFFAFCFLMSVKCS